MMVNLKLRPPAVDLRIVSKNLDTDLEVSCSGGSCSLCGLCLEGVRLSHDPAHEAALLGGSLAILSSLTLRL